MAKTIDTLVDDIQALFKNGHVTDPKLLEGFGRAIADVVGSRLSEHQTERGSSILRMSNIGKPDRQLWYDTHREAGDRESLNPSIKIKFMFGDILEQFLLYLAVESGHSVEHTQARVELDGVPGSIDCIIDGVLVDVKSASTFSFQKFKDGSLVMDDPFGYIQQLAGYSAALGGIGGAFLVIDKTLGHICLLQYDGKVLEAFDARSRVGEAKRILAMEEPPERCYEPKEDGKSGNLILSVGCSYCPFKKECWSDSNDGIGLRTFLYSTGPRHFVQVLKEPQVAELTF